MLSLPYAFLALRCRSVNAGAFNPFPTLLPAPIVHGIDISIFNGEYAVPCTVLDSLSTDNCQLTIRCVTHDLFTCTYMI